MLRHRQISLVQRPINRSGFASIVCAAGETRQRHYQVRDLLADLVQTDGKQCSRTELLQKLALKLSRTEDR
jgi:hypothetical protein